MAPPNSNVAIGIDFGTSYSSVGVWINGKVEIIPNDLGHKISPSYIAFKKDMQLQLVGDAAKFQVGSNCWDIVHEFKTLLGRKFDDPSVNLIRWNHPFKIVDVGGKPGVEVELNGESKCFTPEKLSSMMLMNLKHKAEAYLSQVVTEAVITIPAGFNKLQVAALRKAAEMAGLNILRMIRDPNAAALAYVDQTGNNDDGGNGGGGEGEKNLLIYHFGGGTIGVSIVTVRNWTIEVKAVVGNTSFGGENLDTRMTGHLCVELRKKCNTDIRCGRNPPALQRLRAEWEKAKIMLSRSPSSINLDIEDLHEGLDFHTDMTQQRFESRCNAYFDEVLKPAEKAMRDANMEKSDIHDIVLVGGSSRIPKIQELLRDYFNGKELNKSLSMDEASAHGATILAAVLSGCSIPRMNLPLFIDVTSISLGVEMVGGNMATLIPINTPIPTKRTAEFTTVYDRQSAVIITVFEGEKTLAKDNVLVGSFFLSEIPPVPAGVPKIEITFDLDDNGILVVTATDKSTGNEKQIMINPGNEELLTREQITETLIPGQAVESGRIQAYQRAYEVLRGVCAGSTTPNITSVDKQMETLVGDEARNKSLLNLFHLTIGAGGPSNIAVVLEDPGVGANSNSYFNIDYGYKLRGRTTKRPRDQ